MGAGVAAPRAPPSPPPRRRLTLRAPRRCPAFLEKPRNFPTDGKHSWYGSGFGFGVWWTALQARGLDVRVVGPAVWKRDVGLYGRAFTKDDSRARALLLYPTLEAELRRHEQRSTELEAWKEQHEADAAKLKERAQRAEKDLAAAHQRLESQRAEGGESREHTVRLEQQVATKDGKVYPKVRIVEGRHLTV